MRNKLPDDRNAITHKFSVGGHKGYLIVGLYEDGTPGELFIYMNKQGSTLSGLMDTIGILTSMSLQNEVPLKTLTQKLVNRRFDPDGFTGNKEIPNAKSIVDYIFRYLDKRFDTEGGETA